MLTPMESDRDLVWDALDTTAERLAKLTTGTLVVRAFRSRPLSLRVTEGLEVADNWTDLKEPVRWRWSREWHELQPVQTAASKVGAFLRERPDLR